MQPKDKEREEEPKSTGEDVKEKRMSLYMEPDLFNAIEADVAASGTGNKNSWVVGLLQLVLLSDVGETLKEFAQNDQKTVLDELKELLTILDRDVPLPEIRELARATQRNTPQMLVYLLRIGLKTYNEHYKEPRF